MGLEPPQITLGNGTLNAFNFFPTPAQVTEPSQDRNKRFVCGFVMGSANPSSGSGTGCGLFAAINKISDPFGSGDVAGLNILASTTEFFNPHTLGGVIINAYVIDSISSLKTILNKINNNINLGLWNIDPSRTVSPGPNPTNQALYTSLTENLYFGAYTGKNNVDPNQDGFADQTADWMGNGITAAFGFSSVSTPDTDLAQIIGNDGAASRAGVELYALLHFLKYGGVAVIAPRYHELSLIKDGFRYPSSSGFPLDPERNNIGALFNNRGLDAIVTLEGGSMLTGVGLTGNQTNDAMIYGGAYYEGAGALGQVYNRTQGLLPEHLGNTFAGLVYKGNIFSSIVTDILSPSYLQIFHAGLSGTSFGYQQEFGADPATVGVFRHPSTDGRPFNFRKKTTSISYPGNPNASVTGLTGGILNSNQLNSLVCVGGRTLTKTWWTTTGTPQGAVVGGGADGSYWIPKLDVIEFAGSMNTALQQTTGNYMLSSNIGGSIPVSDGVPNMAQLITSTRYSSTSFELLEDLAAKRINTICSNSPTHFPTDYVGATGAIGTPNTTLLNRRYAQAIHGYAYQTAFRVLDEIVGTNVVNNSATRAQVVTAITDAYNSSNFNSYLRENYVITCDTTNNSNNSTMLTVGITVKPAVFTINSPTGGQLISDFNIIITLS
jgi:hypothetical protein